MTEVVGTGTTEALSTKSNNTQFNPEFTLKQKTREKQCPEMIKIWKNLQENFKNSSWSKYENDILKLLSIIGKTQEISEK
jgi:hypothetical protein